MLATECSFVAAFGEDLDGELEPGVRGVGLDPGNPLAGEWDVIVLSAHFAGAFAALDLGDGGPDLDRRFDFRLTYDRDAVIAAATSLMLKIPA